MQFKDKLKRIRLDRTLTQKELADRSGVSLPVIQSYENGSRNPKDENLQKLASALDVDVWALRDLDIDLTDRNMRASIYYFLFLLSEKGLFSVEDLNTEVIYTDHTPERRVTFKIDQELFDFFSKWKCIVSDEILTDVSLEAWEIDPYPFTETSRTFPLTQLHNKSGRQTLSTKEILDTGTDNYFELLNILHQGAYSEEDFLRILRRLEDSSDFKKSDMAVDMLTAIFAEGSIPATFIDKAFNETDQYGATIIQKGAVRHAFGASQSLSPEELHRLTYELREHLREYLETKHTDTK